MATTHRVAPGSEVRLDEVATTAEPFHSDRKEAEKEFLELREELAVLQHRLYAEGKRKILVVLQAMDAGGKDGTIRKVFKGVNPQGVKVTSFKVPSEEELAHHFLWRILKASPPIGTIGVFNRSHYEDVLVVRVDELVPEDVWSQRYRSINDFERMLTAAHTTVLKFYLHISKKEQRRRLQARLDNPAKNWKFSMSDIEKRSQWPQYMSAYQDALEQCSTEHAPWYVIPSDQKWYRNLAITRVLVGALRDMNPQFPPPAEGLDEVRIE